MKVRNLILAAFALPLFILAGCKEDIIPVEVKVSLNKSALSINKGQTEKLTATVTPSSAEVDLVWTSSDKTVASVSDNGDVTGVTPGEAVITVKAGESSATCKVTVKAIPVQEVTLDQTSATMTVGDKLVLKATVLPSEAEAVVSWKSLNEQVATVDPKGEVTAVEPGSATIVAEAGGKVAQCKITVEPVIINVESVKLVSYADVLIEGEEFQFEASVLPEDATDKTVVWSSSNKEVLTIDSAGKAKAVEAGTVTVKVTSNDGGKTDECVVIVEEPLIPVTGVVINESSDNIVLVKGESKTFTATVNPSDATDKTITWSVSDDTILSVDQNGKVTALAGGSAKVVVTTKDGGKKAECSITVIVPVESVEITSAPEGLKMTEGDTFTFTAVMKPEDATDKNFEWSSSNPSVLTIDQEGKAVAVKAGKAVVSIKTSDGKLSDSREITVEELVVVIPVSSVEFDYDFVEVNPGAEVALSVIVLPENATDKSLVWTSSDETVATVKDGVVKGIKSGQAEITVKTVDGGFTDKCTVNIAVHIQEVQLDETSLELEVGQQSVLTPVFIPADATNKSVIWKTSDSNVADVSEGVVTAKNVGDAVITVETVSGHLTATCAVKVKPKYYPVVSIKISEYKTNILLGETYKFAATLNPSFATDPTYTWSSTNTEVLTVDQDGVVTAVNLGTADIVVTSTDGNKTDKCTVTVDPVPVESVEIVEHVTVLAEGETHQFTATVAPSNATDPSYTWSSSNPEVLTVDKNGMVTAVKPGTADIVVTTTDGKKTDKCTVTVKPQFVSVESVKIVTSPSGLKMDVGSSFKFGAKVSPDDADDKTVTWSSSNKDVLTVDAEGNAKAIAEGEAVVTVTTNDGGKTDRCTITVVTPKVPVTAVEITSMPIQNRMREGDTFTFKAKVTPDNATDKTVTWSTSDDRVLTIDADGKATAVSSGSATVTVKTTDGGKVSKCLVTVTKAGSDIPVTKVTLSAENALTYVRHGKTLQLQPNYEPLGSYPGETTWRSSNENIATVDENGLVKGVSFDYSKSYADYGYGDNYPEVTITLNADGIIATYKVQIRPATPEKIVVSNPLPSSMTLGELWDMGTFTVLPEEAEDSWIWIASSDQGDSQNSSGNANTLTASTFSAKSVGVWSVQITANGTFAQVDHENSARTVYTVNVLPVYETSLRLSRSSYSMEVGNSFALVPELLPANATYTDVSWTSSNSSVAIVNNGFVTAKSPGTATITAKSHHGKTATCQVTVTARTSTVAIGDYYYSDGTTSSELIAGKTPVGVVFALNDAAGSDPFQMGKDYPGCKHGLAVSIKEYESSLSMANSTGNGWTSVYDFAQNKGGYLDMASGKLAGYSNTKAMKDYKSATGNYSVFLDVLNSHNVPVVGASSWYLPSLYELSLIGENYSLLNQKLEAVGDVFEDFANSYAAELRSGIYWSSTYLSGMAQQSKPYILSQQSVDEPMKFHYHVYQMRFIFAF